MTAHEYFVDDLCVEHYPPLSGGNGHPLLFIHGSFGGSWVFENYLPCLSNGGWDCFALNLRGHHKSKLCELWEVTQWDYARDVLAVARTLSAPPVLIGFGMGAQLVQIAFDLKVEAAGAVFISAKRAIFVPQDVPQGVLDMPKLLAGKPLTAAPDMSPNTVAAYNQRLIEQVEPLACVLALLNGEFKISYWAIRVPYLVLNGELDTEISEADGVELAKIYSGKGTFERIADASHEGILAGIHWRQAATRLNYWLQMHHFDKPSSKGA
jgi:pimeloyl-ACP methyl ester carboxylesterase